MLLMTMGAQAVPGVNMVECSDFPKVALSSTVLSQGGLELIKVRTQKGNRPSITWNGRSVLLVPNRSKTVWDGFLGVDLQTKPGFYRLTVRSNNPTGQQKTIEIKVREKDYGVRRLTLPKKMVDLDEETLKRVRKETGKLKTIWNALPKEPLWRGPFVKPIPGKVIGPFGRKSVINNQTRSPHSGVDLKGKRGTPIKTIANGKVALTEELFFGGRSVVIDHGGGIQSAYLHLEKILVSPGQQVDRGDVIGRVGSSGRATGPHLHWSVRVNGARVDPLKLTVLSEQLEQ